MCWDGSCAEACWQCVPVPRCPKGQSRCKDGTCDTEANCQTINAAIAPCNTGLVRCEDGMCRESCCHYDGCGFDAPFYCLNRECAKRSQDCDNIAKGRITYFTRRLLQTTTNDPTKPCYDNCYGEIKAANQKVTVDINRASQITLAVDSSLTPIMRLTIPQGTLVPRTAGTTTTVLDLRVVGESRMRAAFNTVHPTRVGDAPYNFIQYLTFPQTVVSPAFECNVDASIREPFNVNMTVTSLVDNVRRDNSDVWVEDICLAYLLEIGQYKNWVCLFSSQYDRRLICGVASSNPGCVKGRYIVRDPATAPPPDNLVSSVFHRCTQSGATSGTVRRGTVYAFIVNPLADYVPIRKKPADIVESNIVPIILGIIFLILFAIFLIYLAVRLARYRKKYHEERAEADRLKEEVENMTQFGGEAGTKDDQVAMTKNPLAAQLEHLQQAVKEEDIKLQQAEQGLRSQEADIRKDHIDNMRSNRDKMLAELERLKAQLQESQASTAAPSTMEEAPSGGYNAGYDGQASASAGGYGQAEDGAYRAGFDQYQAPRGGGGPKKRDL
jgi:cbb3-type cytochrome oxidase subunit 3